MDGLAFGSLIALVSLGYTMVYGILKFINFAHSDVFVLGAWTSYAIAVGAGLAMRQEAGNAVTPWIFWLAVSGVGAAFLLLAWERLLLDRVPHGVRSLLPGRGTAVTVGGAAAAGWSVIGLISVAGMLGKSKPAGDGAGWQTYAAGGVILLASMMACGLIGFTIERLAYKPLRKAPRLNVLITAIGVSLLLQNMGQLDWMFGTRPQSMPTLLPDKVLVEFGGGAAGQNSVKLRLLDVFGAGTAVVLMVVLDVLVFRTKLGRAMRAVSYNERTASLMGIPVDRVISFTFVLGAALAAAGGFLFAQKYSGIQQSAAPVWVLLGLKAFIAAVVGGIGNIRGAMLGGLLIGLAEMFVRQYQSPALVDVYVFGILILVLLVKPTGLLGSRMQEKV